MLLILIDSCALPAIDLQGYKSLLVETAAVSKFQNCL
jgi:hypothetical protein